MNRTRINLVGIIAVSAVLIIYAITQLLTNFVLDRTYPLFAEIPNASGLRDNKEVTYNGHPIGRVDLVTATADGARVRMAIDGEYRVPTELDVVVLRRSPIGEQAIDLRPVQPVDESTTFYEAGDTVAIRELVLPPDVQDLFETAVDVLRPVDPHSAGVLVAELADTVRGRRDDIRSIMSDSADFSEAIGDNGADFDRFWSSSRVVNAELAEHRDTLAELITDLREATSVLTDMRTDFEGLIAEAPPVLSQVAELVDRAQPNVSCTLGHLANINQATAQPDNLDAASEALRNNRYFFVGFEAQTAYDPAGRNWFRVHFEPPGGPPPVSYLPDKRPIRPIRPGGACSSPFGAGAPAATQASFTPRIPEARISRPGNDRRTSGAGSIGAGPADPPVGAVGTPPVAVVPDGTLPATGGAALPLLLGALTLAGAGALARRRGRRG